MYVCVQIACAFGIAAETRAFARQCLTELVCSGGDAAASKCAAASSARDGRAGGRGY